MRIVTNTAYPLAEPPHLHLQILRPPSLTILENCLPFADTFRTAQSPAPLPRCISTILTGWVFSAPMSQGMRRSGERWPGPAT